MLVILLYLLPAIGSFRNFAFDKPEMVASIVGASVNMIEQHYSHLKV
jgi:hypothetical protein